MGSVVIILCTFLLVLLSIAVFIPLGRAFIRELNYVNMKILNSRHNKELAYWERRKKQLWLSLLPFCHYNRHHDDH